MANKSDATRRDFLKTTAATAGVLATGLALQNTAHAAGDDKIKVGVVGCGGRGSGAAENVLHSAPGVEIVAIGDVFKFRVDGLRNRLQHVVEEDATVKGFGNNVDLPEERCFVGLDAYQKVINSPANYIILATPPGFRPVHIPAVVAAKKNLFTEKPVGVDGGGIRKVLEAYDKSKDLGLHIAAGTQRRHQAGYLETLQRVHDGAIGDLVALRCFWNQGPIWFRKRTELASNGVSDSDLAYQLHNWYHFVWTCGDHICEQHVHNLDVCNWAMKNQHPTRVFGVGGRAQLPHGNPDEVGNIFDHFMLDYEYANGVHMLSMCRQMKGCDGNLRGISGVSEALVGTKGTCQADAHTINGEKVATPRKGTDPYVQEHTDLIESIRKNQPLNELQHVAESTLTAIMGRMAAYTGKMVTWEQALNTKEDTMPHKLAWDMKLETPPAATPGTTKLV
jgi:predicted dehydrogenase